MVTARPRRASGEGAVYDMYPWNQPSDPRDQAPPPRYLAGHAAGYAAQATRAVQVALDRRGAGGGLPRLPPRAREATAAPRQPRGGAVRRAPAAARTGPRAP